MPVSTPTRPLHMIAADVRSYWAKPYFGAVPYIEALEDLTGADDHYYSDTAADIIRYFLANAGGWRGEDAKRIKAELKAHLVGAR